MHVMPCLTFDGRCEEAFTHYAGLLGGRIEGLATFGSLPEPPPGLAADWRGKVANAVMRANGLALMGMDPPPAHYQRPQGFFVTLEIEAPEEAERLFEDLQAHGQVLMPLAETFWARRFAMLTDRFGTPWMLNCSRPGVQPSEQPAA